LTMVDGIWDIMADMDGSILSISFICILSILHCKLTTVVFKLRLCQSIPERMLTEWVRRLNHNIP